MSFVRTEEVDWRRRGRWLTTAAVASLLAIDLWKRSAGVHAASPLSRAAPLVDLVVLALVAVVYGVGEKLADLTAEHGLAVHPWRLVGYAMACLGHAALIPFPAGATWVVADVFFHGVVKGKADTRAHVLSGGVVFPLVAVLFAFSPTALVDWTTVAIANVTGCLWMALNNRWLRLGDNVFHQVRGDAIVVFAVLAVVEPGRWLAFAVIAAAEHLAYACTKMVAIRRPWYRDGEDVVRVDDDRLGLAFHARPRDG